MSSLPTAPATILAGTAPTAAALRTYRDNLNYLLAPPTGRVVQTTQQSIPNVTGTAILFDTETLDSDGDHSMSSNTSRILPVTPGWYRFVGATSLLAGTGYRMAQIWKNGALWQVGSRFDAASGTTSTNPAGDLVYCDGISDYVQLALYQNHGSALNTSVVAGESSFLTWQWVSE